MIGQRLGDYLLEAELGRGGMGTVYRARALNPERQVALKLLPAVSDSEERLRFQREAEAAARLTHPNVVAIHEVGEHAGQRYLVMDLVEGQSLSDALRGGPLEPRVAVELTVTLCGALEAAHAQGLIHRDIKPANVLLDAAGRPQLTDFGLVLQVDRQTRLSLTGEVLGTPAYMAPEQATGLKEEIDARTDVYGLGATLYHLLSGAPPFSAGSQLALLAAVVSDPPPPLTGIDPALAAICARTLAKAPADRYPSAAALREALEAWLRGEARAPRPAWLYPAAGLLILALVGGALAVAGQDPPPPDLPDPTPPATARPPGFSAEAFLQLSASQRTPERVPADGWVELARAVCHHALLGDKASADLSLLAQAPPAATEAVRAAKVAQLERDAARWGELLHQDPARVVERLARIGRTEPRVRAGAQLSAALGAAIDALAREQTRGDPKQHSLQAAALWEQTLFYGIDPTPRWSHPLNALHYRLELNDRSSPELLLLADRYRLREHKLTTPTPSDRLLAEHPNSRLRRARAWARSRARPTHERAEGLAQLLNDPQLLEDLHPRVALGAIQLVIPSGIDEASRLHPQLVRALRRPLARALQRIAATSAIRIPKQPFYLGAEALFELERRVGGRPAALTAAETLQHTLEARDTVGDPARPALTGPLISTRALALAQVLGFRARHLLLQHERDPAARRQAAEAYRAALRALRPAPEHTKQRIGVRILLGRLLLEDGDYRAAIHALTDDSPQQFRYLQFPRYRWRALLCAGEDAKAEADYRRAQGIPSLDQARLRRIWQAVQRFRRVPR